MLVVENGSSFGDESVLACTITVTEREPYETVEIWTETIIFDVSAIEMTNTRKTFISFSPIRTMTIIHMPSNRRRFWKQNTKS